MKQWLHVIMPGGSHYRIPLSVIARHRATTLAKQRAKESGVDYKKAYAAELDFGALEGDRLLEWAREHMIWNDVADYAIAIAEEVENKHTGFGDAELSISDSARRAA